MASASLVSMKEWDEDATAEILIKEYDKTDMPIPDFDFKPDLLINKVRKHYMEYIIKLLTVNYERIGSHKNVYHLPTAIWKCAKIIETSAAQTSMVLHLYRRNIMTVIKELKNDTSEGKLNEQLFEFLSQPSKNEKSSQTTITNSSCNCQCNCDLKRKVRKMSNAGSNVRDWASKSIDNNNICLTSTPKSDSDTSFSFHNSMQFTRQHIDTEKQGITETTEKQTTDELQRQLEKLFEGDVNDDLFEGVCDEEYLHEEVTPTCNKNSVLPEKQYPIVEAHSAQIKLLDERLVSLAGLVMNNQDASASQTPVKKNKKYKTTKWLCEEYFLKSKLYELLDHIRDNNRNKFKGIKILFADLFGDESEEDDVMSPLDETPEFILSCKDRMAPWVIRLLTPFYIKGRIKGKVVFKAVAKHLLKIIYQCSPYPDEYEVQSFVSDFLKSHKVIRCEADFKDFRIMNI